ncbi:MAG: GNAT family N-acetyltransferase [Amphiplicatus sp.]
MGRRIDVTITYLEQRARPVLATPARPPLKVAILRAERPPVHFYRYLYALVGDPYKWVSRKKLSDAELETIIHDPSVYLYVLYVGGVPGGMAEVDARADGIAEIKFFGLASDFIGVGLGRYFLTNVIDLAWALSPKSVRLETCTLDHPAALPLYQKFGFTVFDQRKGQVELLDG